jgi:hypothetical protein
MATQQNYNTAKQNVRNLRVKIDLLNFNFQTVDAIEGNVISGSINIDANSDIRRTCDISLVVTDASFNVTEGGKIWMDKYIQIYTGIDDIRTGETDWINQGIYIINAPSLQFDAVTDTLSFQGLDLMAKLTGARNGFMDDITTTITTGSSIRTVMIETLQNFTQFTRFAIEDNPQKTPYDMVFEVGSTVYDILSQLRDITPNYEIFFDVDGTFVYQKIPTGENDPVIADNDLWDDILISESTDVNFDEVKNRIIVLGRAHDPDHFGSATLVGSEYQVTIATIGVLETDMIIGFTTTALATNPTLKINSLAAKPLVNEDGTPAVLPDAEAFYIVRVLANGNFLYMGRQQIRAEASDTNPTSPYYINGSIGEILLPLYGGEYDNIVTDDLAGQRARYELWLRTRMNDSINLTCVPAYFLDVNQKISYARIGTTTPLEYLMKSISFDLSESGTMSIECIRFYAEYPDI